jgi:protein-S-isoprenylcysteine O-methyltransferase Ste14
MLKWVDMPPVWLAGALLAAWWQKTHFGFALTLGPVWPDLLGGLLVGGGVLLFALAAFEMRRHKTTIIPKKMARTLITSGVYKRTRNPIYLGDAMILTGMILYWDAVLSLPLIPIFVWVIEKRFILQEEESLRRKFVAQFTRYAQQTRRWV